MWKTWEWKGYPSFNLMMKYALFYSTEGKTVGDMIYHIPINVISLDTVDFTECYQMLWITTLKLSESISPLSETDNVLHNVFFLKRSMFRLIWWSVDETESGTSDQVTVNKIYHNHNMWIHAQVHAVLIKHCILSCILYFCQCLHMVLCVDFNRSPRHPDKYLIKRIVGLEGDIVQ